MKNNNHFTGLEIAIIGVSCRYSGAKNVDEFWNNLQKGKISIQFSTEEELERLTEGELEEAGFKSTDLKNPKFIPSKGGVVKNKEYFDAAFFNYTPNEAEILDPQIRIFHELSWEALEDAGYIADRDKISIGVFAGASSSFMWEGKAYLADMQNKIGQLATRHLVNKDFIATRVSHKLKLKGPSIVVNTLCSTSLVTVHLACRSLLTGDCNIALAGGVSLNHFNRFGYLYEEGSIYSKDGYCKAFDENSSGTIYGEGAGVVVLKRLKDAINDQDNIYAIIKGSAINNDADRKVGYTAPSIEGQSEVIKKAIKMSQIKTDTISYIETHGTGTSLGDSIEIEGLKEAFDTNGDYKCPIGSVKTSIGHTDAGAGVASLIKTALILKNKIVPPNPYFNTPNSKIDLKNSPFYVNKEIEYLEEGSSPHRAGVSSFGIGGTNAHVIMEEPIRLNSVNSARNYFLFNFSAKALPSLNSMLENFKTFLEENKEASLQDIAYTLNTGREQLNSRISLVAHDREELIKKLISSKNFTNSPKSKSIVFLFPGQSAQYYRMCYDLYNHELNFKKELDNCFSILSTISNHDFKTILFEQTNVNSKIINNTEIAQPLLFIIEFSIAQTLIKYGISPKAMIGHSIGEYVAACLANVFSLQEALTLVCVRGKLMNTPDKGSMLSVDIKESDLQKILPGNLSVAAINSKDNFVISGKQEYMKDFSIKLDNLNVTYRQLKTSHAFHSQMMDSILKQYEIEVGKISLKKPEIPYISNISGTWITEDQACRADYYVKHLRDTVRFSQGIQELLKIDNVLFVEVGPGKSLTTLLNQFQIDLEKNPVVPVSCHPREKQNDEYCFTTALSKIWENGCAVDWQAYYANEKRAKVSLPTYPFIRQKYWFDVNKAINTGQIQNTLESFLYTTSWREVFTSNPVIPELNKRVLLFLDNLGFGETIYNLLLKHGYECIIVKGGSNFNEISNSEYTINYENTGDYPLLFKKIVDINKLPSHIIHLALVTGRASTENESMYFNQIQNLGLYSHINIAKTLVNIGIDKNINIYLITDFLYKLPGEEYINCDKSTVLGALKVIPQEINNVEYFNFDIKPGSYTDENLASQLICEIFKEDNSKSICFRENKKFIQTFHPFDIQNIRFSGINIRENGIYLITGGLGRIGIVYAKYLASKNNVKLIFLNRSRFPDRKSWKFILKQNEDIVTCSKIKILKEIEESGSELHILNCDITDYSELKGKIDYCEEKIGKINGVVHAAGLLLGKANYCEINKVDKVFCENQLKPKIHGVINLDSLVDKSSMDFLCMVSSLSSIIGGIGFTAYSAANSYLDAYAALKQNYNFPVITVNWEGWNFNFEEKEVAKTTKRSGISPEEGMKLIDVIFRYGETTQIVICKGNLNAEIKKWVYSSSTIESENDHKNLLNEKIKPLYTRPSLSTKYTLPTNPIEKTLQEIWQSFFGHEIGIDDDYFELGGDSLKIIKLINVIQKKLELDVDFEDIYDFPTIKLLADKCGNSSINNFKSIKTVEKQEFYELSPVQKRIYFVSQLNEGKTNYNLPEIYKLNLKVSEIELVKAYSQLIERYEILRTGFEIINGQIRQKVHNKVKFQLEKISFESSEELTQEEVRDEMLKFSRPFQLNKPPLLRVKLIKTKENSYLITDLHHIISDAISKNILNSEIIAILNNQPIGRINVHYKDYCFWHNRFLTSNKYSEQKKYWLQRFEEDFTKIEIPTDFQRKQDEQNSASLLEACITGETVQKVNAIIHHSESSLFIFMLSVLNILFFKYTGIKKIILGAETAGRRHIDVEKMPGMFVGLIPLRNEVPESSSFLNFIREVRANTLMAFDNQDLEFDDLVRNLKAKADINNNPLFGIILRVGHSESFDTEFMEIKQTDQFSRVEFINTNTTWDLHFNIIEVDNKIIIKLLYANNLYTVETVNNIINRINEIIQQVIENVNMPIKDICLTQALQKSRLRESRKDINSFDF